MRRSRSPFSSREERSTKQVKIAFAKIGKSPKSFAFEKEGVSLSGTLERSGLHRLKMDADFSGERELLCDRCGKRYTHCFSQALEMTLSEETLSTKEDLDIIEFLDGVVDFDYIVESELASLEGAFHFCSACEESSEILEIEF